MAHGPLPYRVNGISGGAVGGTPTGSSGEGTVSGAGVGTPIGSGCGISGGAGGCVGFGLGSGGGSDIDAMRPAVPLRQPSFVGFLLTSRTSPISPNPSENSPTSV